MEGRPSEIGFRVARRRRERLRGLAFLDRERAPGGLLIPRCSSVHTFGMRFALDLYFLDRRGRVLAVRRGVGRRRVVWQRGASAVLEVPAARGRLAQAMTERVHHPIFARAWERISSQSEARGGGEHRRRLLAGLSGEVIELGAGSGANFRHYPSTVTRVLAVEPEQHLRGLAEAAAASVPLKIEVIEGVSSELPAEDASFDAGVVSLVLCSVPDQGQALSELRRVIRPGGELRFYEHVVSKKRVEARIQRFADATFWPRVAGGCHSSRDTSSAIERAGFEITDCDRFPFSPAPLLPPAPHVLGVARRR